MRESIWTGSISFGLLNIPVSILTAQEDRSLHFSLLDSKDHSRIRYKRVNESTGQEVPYSRIVKGYEYETDRFVVITPDDFRDANVKATQTVDIEDFVSMDDIDPMFFEKPYYLTPRKGGEKGYFLLHDALKTGGKAAIAKVVIRAKQHLCAIFPRGEYLVLEIMRFAHEVKQAGEATYLKGTPRGTKPKPAELQMAKKLIDGMTTDWKPERYQDTYYDDLKKHIERKARAGGKSVAPKAKKASARATRGQPDLMALLKASLRSGGKKRAAEKPGRALH